MIPFTQYLRPNGAQRPVTFTSSEDIETKARKLAESGARFEVELLATGEVSLSCEAAGEDGELNVLAIEVVPNGPAVIAAVERLVETAWSRS